MFTHLIDKMLERMWLVFAFCVAISCALETELTVHIPAGKQQCFHQLISAGHNVEVEYQVVDGGDQDVNFKARSPGGTILFDDYKKMESTHKFQSKEPGDYEFCLDNGFSSFSHKDVFFELITDEKDATDKRREVSDLPETDELYDMKIGDVKTRLEMIKERLERSIQTQSIIKNYEARDRNTVERSFERVNLWSGVQLFIMVTVGLIQVIMIRGLFDERSHVTKLFKTRS